ncbi:hypothetical protein FNT36_06890 [Hymenobacter setariae]|uniref:DUF4249 family protein n=1 Tax=Hymenobacter setariae TaxID=2594794 RepID=A0A558BXF5_9BACT|nr:hypothetical protein [Hymenobacter setariae]TVT41181.1 hypothetical protein FNT36_06890 [Hymenobacter setariae]
MNRLFLLLGLAGLLLAAGCRKDDLVECAPTPTSNLSLSEFTQRNGAPVQSFNITLSPGGAPQVITTTGRATLTFPADGFLLPTGAAATGSAQVRVREIYSVPDMILSNMPTQTTGDRRVLISGGEFSIQVWQNGTRLRLASGFRVVVASPLPAGASAGQQLLWQQLATPVPDSAGWALPAQAGNDSIRLGGIQPTFYTPIPLDSVSWWNIDRLWSLYQSAPIRTIAVQVPAIPAASTGSTQVFIRVTSLNGLARLYPSRTVKTNWIAQLPTGANMVAAVLQSVNGQLYFGSQPLTTQNGLVVTPTLTAVSEADAVRLIRQL